MHPNGDVAHPQSGISDARLRQNRSRRCNAAWPQNDRAKSARDVAALTPHAHLLAEQWIESATRRES
ncbi:hypothetical protein BTO02_06815 [Paraburkholderia sp. SOS3]|nr:hypothetical protein BTO02_06815 [Paraburkholderia sp. SOS3]